MKEVIDLYYTFDFKTVHNINIKIFQPPHSKYSGTPLNVFQWIFNCLKIIVTDYLNIMEY